MRPAIIILLAASLVGIGISIFSALHNAEVVSGTFCDISETVNCDAVNRSDYSEIAGIPVAWMGLLGYGFLFTAGIAKWRAPSDRGLSLFLLLAAIGGMAFALYLTGIEAFVLRAWCILCIVSQVMILTILGCALWLYRSPSTAESKV